MQAERDTAAWKIFNRFYLVAIPNKYLYSDDFIREIGIHAPDNETRRDLMDAARRVNKRLSDIIVLADRGAPVTFLKPGAGVEAYTIVFEHLRDWVTILTEAISPPRPKMEDLEAMDNFCRLLYHHFVGRSAVVRNKESSVVGPIKPFIGAARNLPDLKKKVLTEDARPYESCMPMIAELVWSRYGPIGKPLSSGDIGDN